VTSLARRITGLPARSEATGHAPRGPFASFAGKPIETTIRDFRASVTLAAGASYARRTASAAARLMWWTGITDPVEIAVRLTRLLIERYIGSILTTGRSRKTAANHVAAINVFCRWLAAVGLIGDNPSAGIHIAAGDVAVPRYLEPDEIVRVMEIARSTGTWPEVALALATGLRLGELIRLQWTDVHTEGRWLLVRQSKSHRPRTVPLSVAALDALAVQWQKSGNLSYVFPARRTYRGGWKYIDAARHSSWWLRAMRPVQDAIPKFRQSAGTGRAWHLFRHTFASRLAQAGVSLYKIAQWMGHSDIRTTQIYAHLQAGFDPDIEAGATGLTKEPML